MAVNKLWQNRGAARCLAGALAGGAEGESQCPCLVGACIVGWGRDRQGHNVAGSEQRRCLQRKERKA